jgi:hypothetical protein
MLKSPIIATAMFLAVLGTASCASAGGPHGSSCAPLPRDSTYAAAGPVYRDCAVDTKAKSVGTVPRPDFQPSSARNACYFAELEFVVDKGGRPEMSTATVLHTNERSFADAELATVSAWKYEPAMLAGAPVRQIVTERKTVAVMTVLVPAGSGPPTSPPPDRASAC